MTRKKVKLVWIVNDAARKASLKKRRIGLLKKVSELTTLCGVSAFAIIYSPDEREPMLWPSRPVVQQLLMRYQTMPEIERCKKMMNQESYLKERIAKVQEQFRKHQRKNREIELACLMDRLHQGNGVDDFEVNELQGLIWLLEEKMKDIRKRVEYFQQVPPLPPGPFPLAPPLPLSPHGGPIMEQMGHQFGGGGSGGDIMRDNPTDAMVWDQWFVDMMNNSENIAGSSSGTKNEQGHHPQGFNITGIPGGDGGGLDMGLVHPGNFGDSSAGNIIGLGLPQGNMNMGVTPFDLGVPPHHGNPFGLGLQPYENFTGSSSANAMGPGLTAAPPSSTTGGSSIGSELGLPGFFTGGSDIGLPYDVTKPWPQNFSP
ncbi:hypothetical protein P3X46_004300 [Hevea brasiliensis]|uniref:MADS-box domain-containing protein n=1 Tax=Hevea brasiliensis TaxID=3981 RepID=A0ABQ9MYI9_HEVBR|nr:hypothetical protein P3X46_004300 [Hevea brasiliensis]